MSKKSKSSKESKNSKENSLDAERRVAVEAVLLASGLCRTVQANLVSDESMSKKDRSPVTVADFGAQAVVTQVLRQHFPDIPMVGEEDAAELRDSGNAELTSKVVANVREVVSGLEEAEILDLIDYGTYEGGGRGRHWTLDPIDGTKGFLRLDQYAVALALIEDGEVVLGVLGCPNLPVKAGEPDGAKGCLFIAVKGGGASMRTLDDAKESAIHVTEIRDTAQASFCESVESAHSSQSDSARVAELLGIEAPPYRIDSQCKYAAVSRGDASIYLRLPTRKDYEEKIWDHAAGAMVIREAGGRVTDVSGKDLDFSIGRTLRDNKGVIVTNGHVHDRVIAAVGEVLGL
ncbi:MAG: 3'(2'),5'-bisphosphate nucleotidase [Deltaproteobacteria bacterium]|nr:3'(2'),5'-bisphosphate nucleotidase [Deltaproteobacteria bacterium]MBW2419453.1 3'(2'),5'-bisphosphate nucleotidase [Deltaproteobacteria bacterium]